MAAWLKDAAFRKKFALIFTVAWGIGMVVLCGMAFVSDELSIWWISWTAIFVTPFLLGTAFFYLLIFYGSLWRRWYLAVLPGLFLALVIFQNFVPRHFQGDGNDSPFDRIWYSWPQTAYGYPSPVYRIFDEKLEPYGAHLLDVSSGLLNLWMLAGGLFFLLGAEVLFAAGLRRWCAPKPPEFPL